MVDKRDKIQSEEVQKRVISKKCTKCNIEKSILEFNKNKKHKDGLTYKCKKCIRNYKLKYNRSLLNKIKIIYRQQFYKSKQRGHDTPSYNINQFINYCLNSKKFIKLYDNWVINDYDSLYAPSIDRLDDYKGYSFDNIQVVTWRENKYNLYKSKIKGVNNKQSTAILKFDLNGNFIKEYYSISQAARSNKIGRSNIWMCAKNKRISTGGYKWKFKNNDR